MKQNCPKSTQQKDVQPQPVASDRRCPRCDHVLIGSDCDYCGHDPVKDRKQNARLG